MTAEDRFRYAVEVVLRHEGGYVYDPVDPGGETKYGISKRSYPNLDIKALTKEQAIEIYRRDWWDRYGYDRIEPLEVAAKVLDMAVNMGPDAAHRCLQRALHACGRRDVIIDGIIGPQTVGAANSVPPEALLAALRSEAASHYRMVAFEHLELRRFLAGWLNRAYS